MVSARALLVCVVVAALTMACGSTTAAGTTIAVDTTAAVEAPPASGGIDAASLSEQAGKVPVPHDKGAFMVVVLDADGAATHGATGTNPDGNPPTPQDGFRIGSITKTFTAALVMALVDDGMVDLDDPVSEHITRVDVPEGVTVRDLLQHTSGIPNYTDEPTFPERMLADGGSRVWTPESAIEMVADRPTAFEPGTQFAYSNTNYLMLGILVEEVGGKPLATQLHERIIDPLRLNGTYLAGAEDGPEPFGAYSGVSGRTKEIDFDYTATATDAWAAGAMVSTAGDLHTLLRALFDGTLVSAEALEAMTENDEYGFGIVKWASPAGLFGHGGGIPGYGTLVAHHPGSGATAFWVATNDAVDFGRAVDPVAERLADH